MSRYYDDVLIHHQRKGAHWGVKNGPPYPLNAQGVARFKKKVKEMKDGLDNKKAQKQIKKAAKAEAKAEKKAEKHQKALDNLSKSPSYLWKHRDAFTTEELNKALNRINTEQRLHEASMKELRRGKDIADTIIGYGKTVNDAYNTFNNMSKNWSDFKAGKFGKEHKSDDGDKKDKNKNKDKENKSDSDSGSSSNSNKSVPNQNTSSNSGSSKAQSKPKSSNSGPLPGQVSARPSLKDVKNTVPERKPYKWDPETINKMNQAYDDYYKRYRRGR